MHGAEGGVAAVVGPVGVDHPDLGDGGVAALARGSSPGRTRCRPGPWPGRSSAMKAARPASSRSRKPSSVSTVGGHGQLHAPASARLVQRGLARLHGVDHVALDRRPRPRRTSAPSSTYTFAARTSGALALADAAGCTRWRSRRAGRTGRAGTPPRRRRRPPPPGISLGGHVGLRLAEHRGHALREQLVVMPSTS